MNTFRPLFFLRLFGRMLEVQTLYPFPEARSPRCRLRNRIL